MSRLPTPAEAGRWWPDAPADASLRARLAGADAALADAFWSGARASALVHARAWVIEQAVLAAWQPVGAVAPALALVATGGFGRGELHPRSDVDLLVLVPDVPAGEVAAAIEAFFARLWDQGLSVGHAVRTPAECRAAALGDISIATNLMEARLIAGDAEPFEAMRAATAAPAVWPVDKYVDAKLAEQAARHARYHDTAYNLEPNVKEGPGGLRDLQVVLWLAQRESGARTFEDLRDLGVLAPSEYDALIGARETLWRVRFGLHLVARRAEERLLFEHQRELASRFGYVDEHAQNRAVEQFMQGFYRAAMTVDRLDERLVQRIAERLLPPNERLPLVLDDTFCIVAWHLDLRRPEKLEQEPATALRAFRYLLERPNLKGLRSTLLAKLDEALPAIENRLRDDADAHAEFLAILRHPGPVDDVLKQMSRYGVLGRYLPAFGQVAGRMQYDLFHVYTVDQHTLTVIEFMRKFARTEPVAGFSLAQQTHQRLRKPELLLLAGLFHDIAKGRGGDHSELGEAEARAFCAKLGLSATDADLVAWLVRQHLVMSVTAQKSDISDPAVVHRFATLVAERERLDYLYVLTVADINGTSPKLWNTWKDRLLADLYQATRYALRRGLEHPVHASERVAETKAAARALLVDLGLGAAAVDALWADFPDDCFLRFSAEQVAWQTQAILGGPAGGATAGPGPAPIDANAGATSAAPAPPLVAVRSAPARGTTDVFVYSPDRDGLFATITAVLDRLQLGVVDARVMNTRSGMALDTFQVLEADGRPIAAPERLAMLRTKLEAELARDPLTLTPARRAVSRRQREFHVPTRIEFNVDAASGRTQLALVCSDRPGLLAHVAQAFRECRVRVHDARIATFGERVEDFFQLSDENDRPLTPEHEDRLSAAVLRQIDGATASLSAASS
jgi:[protein-PII] uridylyltransferase